MMDYMTTFPTMDPELAAALPMLPDLRLTDLSTARTTLGSLTAMLRSDLSYDEVDVRVLAAAGADGAPDVPIRFITPRDVEGPLPVLVWFHGGGFVLGTAESSDPFCVGVARKLRFAVANVEYRLAPETPYPGPLDDCYAALTHVYTHADELGIDPARIAVGGQSAGGGLAAGTVLRARDEGIVPVAFQVLDIPELDDRLTTPSMTTFVDTPMWNRPNAVASWQCYLGDRSGTDDVPAYAAPARETDLRGLPRTYLTAMELDPLRDEGIGYALGMLAAGVSVELHSFPGTFHGSAMVRTAEVSRRAHREMLRALGDALAR